MQWKLAYAPHSDAAGADLRRISEIEHSGFPCISASVPGNLELDLMKAGTLPDLFFSDNVYESQKLETLHVWYYAVLDIDNSGQYLHFEGIDTFSDIFVNGSSSEKRIICFFPMTCIPIGSRGRTKSSYISALQCSRSVCLPLPQPASRKSIF